MRASDANNLKQLGLVCKMFANENKDYFPPLSPAPGRLTPDPAAIYPEYLTDVRVLISPALQDTMPHVVETAFDDHSYWYLPYLVENERAGLAVVEAYWNAVAEGRPIAEALEALVEDWEANGADGQHTARPMRIREGIERFLIKDINNPAAAAMSQSKIPVFIGRPGLIDGGGQPGAHVLYMDGHVEWLKYPSKFPMTEAFIEALRGLDGVQQPASPPQAGTTHDLSIRDDGTCELNGTAYDGEALRTALADTLKPGDQVLIRAGIAAPAALLTRVMDAIRAAGVENVSVAVAAAEANATPFAFAPPVAAWVRDNDGGEAFSIDFDTGQLASAYAWDDASAGLDCTCDVSGQPKNLICAEMVVVATDHLWDGAPADVVRHLFGHEPGTKTYLDVAGELPKEFVFKTRDGAMGVLRVTGMEDDQGADRPRGVGLEYKLVTRQEPA